MSRILVAGAAERVGGAVVERLLSGDHGHVDVDALTHNPPVDTAWDLAADGATVVSGDTRDRARMDRLCAGVDGVFLAPTPNEGHDEGGDGRATSALLEAAVAAGAHVVFGSTVGADADADLPFLASRAAVERRLRDAGARATVLRAGSHMHHFERRVDAISDGELAWPLAAETRLGLVDAADVGRFAAMAFDAPRRFAGETVDLVGDALTLAEVAAALSSALGREVTHRSLDPADDGVRSSLGGEVADVCAWFNDGGVAVDPATVAGRHGVDLRTFADYLADGGVWSASAGPR